jgi:hypothetical protein
MQKIELGVRSWKMEDGELKSGNLFLLSYENENLQKTIAK